MQKKLMAVAVAGALGVPAVALAQTSTVQIFGTMYVEYSFGVDQGRGAVAPAPDRTTADFLQTPGSEISKPVHFAAGARSGAATGCVRSSLLPMPVPG